MKPSILAKLCSILLLSSTSLMMISCDKSDTADTVLNSDPSAADLTSEKSITRHADIFSGCYTVSHDEPPQIKISKQAQGLVMQMKEPKSANRVWDDPEPLEPMAVDTVSKYFSVGKKDVEAVIGRPDRVFVVAQVKQAYVNIDPTLDSPYLGYILQGANTIYKVECDETPADELMQNPHSGREDVGNITIKPAGKVQN